MMKIVSSEAKVFGPYRNIVETDEALLCDAFVLPKQAVGNYTIVEVAEDYKNPTELQREKDIYNAAQKELRAAAYKEETDALFFKAQRGEIPITDWLTAVDSVKSRYPYKE